MVTTVVNGNSRTKKILSFFLCIILLIIVVLVLMILREISPSVMAQTIISGLLLGGFYALTTAGLTLSMGVAKLLNLTHGHLVIIGFYIAYLLDSFFGIEPLIIIPISAIVTGLIGVSIQGLVFAITRPERRRRLGERESIFQGLLIMFSLALVIQNFLVLTLTTQYRTLDSFLTGSAFNIFGCVISLTRLTTFITGICCLILLHLFIYKTRLGIKIRAASQHKDAAWAYGVNVQSISLFTFALSGAMAGIAGVLMGLITSVNPVAGLSLVLFAFPIMVLAGFGEVLGVIIVGIIIGVAESIISVIVGQQFRIVAVYSILLILFLIRPQGLFKREVPT